MSIVHLKTPVTCVEMSTSYTYACHIVCVTELQLNCSNKKNGIGRRALFIEQTTKERERKKEDASCAAREEEEKGERERRSLRSTTDHPPGGRLQAHASPSCFVLIVMIDTP